MRLKSLRVFGLVAFAAAALQGQTYWSTDSSLDCTGTDGQATITIPGGGTGYVCYQGGTFVWLAAGGPTGGTWTTYLRTSAPASNPMAVDYQFYDPSGNQLSIDSISGTGGTVTSANEVTIPLSTNQPLQTTLLGATSTASSNYNTTTTGSVWVTFLCPDAGTCELADAQLVYSALPTIPWSLSVPLAYDYDFNSQFSGVGIDNNGSNRVSIVVNNQDFSLTTPSAFLVQVFDGNGTLAASGMTPAINPVPVDSTTGNPYGQGGTYGALLSCASGCPITSPLPSGPFKVLIDGGGIEASTEMLQIDGTSATTVAMAYDVSSGVTATGALTKQNSKAAAMRKVRALAAAQRAARRLAGQ